MMYAAIINLLSGMLVPLAFLPGPMRAIANVLPFRAVIMIPNEIYLGQIPIWQGLGLQVFWIGVLVLACRYVLSIGERQLVVQGG
jgi:ABC-2 type transport system permease protein